MELRATAIHRRGAGRRLRRDDQDVEARLGRTPHRVVERHDVEPTTGVALVKVAEQLAPADGVRADRLAERFRVLPEVAGGRHADPDDLRGPYRRVEEGSVARVQPVERSAEHGGAAAGRGTRH